MANPHRGEVKITLAGQEYTLRPTFDALAQIENDLGMGMAGVTARFFSRTHGFREIESIVRNGIIGAGGQPPKDLRDLLVKDGITKISSPVIVFVSNAILGDREVEPSGEA